MKRYTSLMRSVLIPLGAFALLLLPSLVFADEVFVPLTSIPGVEEVSNQNNLSDFLNTLYRLCVGAAAVLAVIQITRAGVVFMLQDSVTERKEARHLIEMSILGLVLVLAPTVVFGVIDPRILSLEIDASSLALRDPGEVDISAEGGETEQEEIDGVQTDDNGALVACSENWEGTVDLEDLGEGDIETGEVCCAQMGGEVDAGAQTCDLTELESRWVINIHGKADWTEGSSNRQTNADYRIFSVGYEGGFDGRDKTAIGVHGFRSQSDCTAVIANENVLVAHIEANPRIGRVQFQHHVWGYPNNVPLSRISDLSFDTIRGGCEEFTY